MTGATSFVDLLFILLCGTIVLLSQSIRLNGVEATPAEIGGGAVSEILVDDVKIVGISETNLQMDGRTFDDAADLGAALQPGNVLVLVSADDQVTHHRMMRIWSQVHELGHKVKLGVRPTGQSNKTPTRGGGR